VLGLACADLAITPPGEFVHPDPTTCLTGIKFDTPGGLEDCESTDPHLFNIVLAGNVPVSATPAGVTMTTKAGQLVSTACLQGPDCCAVAAHCDDQNPLHHRQLHRQRLQPHSQDLQRNNACTDDECDPDTGNCAYTPNSDPCNDHDACTGPDFCSDGSCGGSEIVCDDGELCTTDTCNSDSGCVFTANSLPCDDHDGCTDNDHCAVKHCVGGGPENCDDQDDCTADSCVSPGGCVNMEITGCCISDADCADTNLCATADHCVAHTCASTPVTCDDHNDCTDDSCDPQTGCQNPNNNNACDDHYVCTPNDRCTGGSCVGTGELDRDDRNGCTDDECVPGSAGGAFTGCQHTNNTASCTDNDACTVGDVCAGGSCTSGAPFGCADEFFCTTDTCADVAGSPVCQYNPSSDPNCCETSSDCDDQDVCTDDACINHTCTHGPAATPPVEVCDNGSDDDCDQLIDCDDPECAAVRPCKSIGRDPSVIRFGRPGKPDLFKSHGNVVPTASFDIASQEVAWVLSNSHGIIYGGSLIPGDLILKGPHAYYFTDLGALKGTGKRFGIFKAKVWGTGSVYYKIKAYGDLSSATEPQMPLQFYIGDQTFIVDTTWRKTSHGWVAKPLPIS
jgi:hypothetical protein